jgi:hypothetical protein
MCEVRKIKGNLMIKVLLKGIKEKKAHERETNMMQMGKKCLEP